MRTIWMMDIMLQPTIKDKSTSVFTEHLLHVKKVL